MKPISTVRPPICNLLRGILFIVPVLLIALLLPSCSLLNLGLLKLRFGCLPEGSKIDTAAGPVKIENLKAGDTITGFRGSQVVVSQIHQYREDPAGSRYLTISFSNGSRVSTSPRHRIDGKPAEDLGIGDPCGGEIVTGIEVMRGVSRSYDLLTEDAGYRVDGIPVNSMIEEMLGR